MKVLITSGATREPIDRVRFVSNFSSGKTGAVIAECFAQAGVDTTLLCGVGAVRPEVGLPLVIRRLEYGSFQDLNQRLEELLGQEHFDAIIHAAAVSDFSVQSPHPGKLDSEREELMIQLKKNFKIVERLKDYAHKFYSRPSAGGRRDPVVIAFKLTDTSDLELRRQAVFKLSLKPQVDYVVHNDWAEISQSEEHTFRIFRKNQGMSECSTKQELARQLLKLVTTPTQSEVQQ
jgi:phosphopantothenoylcysteine decarboxylase/phosphopantothenate--cysteine ligase